MAQGFPQLGSALEEMGNDLEIKCVSVLVELINRN